MIIGSQAKFASGLINKTFVGRDKKLKDTKSRMGQGGGLKSAKKFHVLFVRPKNQTIVQSTRLKLLTIKEIYL
jgi:hypothetical protein